MSDTNTTSWQEALNPVLDKLGAIAATRDRRAQLGVAEASPPLRILVSGPPGSGQDQVCQALAEALHGLGLTPSSDVVRSSPSTLLDALNRESNDLNSPPTAGRPTGRDSSQHGPVVVVCERQGSTGEAELRRVMGSPPAEDLLITCVTKALTDPAMPSVIVFALDIHSKAILNEHQHLTAFLGLHVELGRPTPEDLGEDLIRLLTKRDYVVSAASRKAILETLELRPTLNLDDTSALSDSIALAHAERIAGRGADRTMKSISREDVLAASPRKPLNQSIEQVLAEFDEFVGMDAIKDRIRGLADLSIVRNNNSAAGVPLVNRLGNFVFVGPPGTGKTTIARKLGEVFRALGMLKSGHVVSHTRASLVGAHVGATEQKVTAAIEASREGVLFIDEAYMLADNSADEPGTIDGRHYGQIALATLIAAMTDPTCQPFICIVAGYPEQMRHFLSSNPGLSSRFSDTIEFEDYTGTELAEIFARNAKGRKLRVASATVDAARAVLEDARIASGNDFGNAREAIRLVDRAVEEASQRVLSTDGLEAAVRDLSPRDVYAARSAFSQTAFHDVAEHKSGDYLFLEEAEDRIREQSEWSPQAREKLMHHLHEVHAGKPIGFGSVLPRSIHDVLVLESSSVKADDLATILYSFYAGLGLLSNKVHLKPRLPRASNPQALVGVIDSAFADAPGRCVIIERIEKWVPAGSREMPARALTAGMREVRDSSLVIATSDGPLEARSISMRSLEDEFELILN